MSLCLFSAAPSAAEWWPIALPLLVGGAAIYLLLPRPRPYPVAAGAGLGLLALVLTGVFLTRSRVVSVETILFWTFSITGVVSGGLLVTQHNPARAALSFTLVVLSTCGLFLLLAAPFLMAATIIIYAGAIIVTFLFIIMLAQQIGLSDADDRSREPLLTTVTGFVLLGTVLFVLQRYDRRVEDAARELDQLIVRTKETAALDSRADMEKKIGEPWDENELFLQFNNVLSKRAEWADLNQRVKKAVEKWPTIEPADPHAADKSRVVLQELIALGEDARHRLSWLPATTAPLSDLSGPPPTVQAERVRRDATGLPRMPADNAAYLGRSLFTDFLLPVELGGSLLLVATVGAIAIAFRRS